MKIHISSQNLNSQYLTIKIIFDKKVPKKVQLPTWRPGRYELQNFAQNLRNLTFVADQKESRLKRLNTHCWEVEPFIKQLEIKYEYFANQMDAGGSWLDNNQAYINFINCIFQPIDVEDEPISIVFQFDQFNTFATALQQSDHCTLTASNYYHLIDSPVIYSSDLQHQEFRYQEYHFHLWIQGNCKPNWKDLLQKFVSFTKEQITLFGSLPTKHYHFLFQILPYKHYHGVEHSSSTVLTLGPKEDFENYDFQINLLGVSSHELFHAWNVCRIRPKEFIPHYDYSKENLYETGYITEGLTTYYGDYLLARSGVFSSAEYFTEINIYLKRHFENDGRHNSSLADSSYKLWLDGYKLGAPHSKVSIYIKGALCALILDLEICIKTKGSKSLDDVMRSLWSKYGNMETGYTHDSYKKIIEDLTNECFDWYFDGLIFGTQDLLPHLDESLKSVGCYILEEKNELINERLFGFRLKNNKIIKIAQKSPAENLLRIGDELSHVEKNLPENHIWAEESRSIRISIIRSNEILNLTIEADQEFYFNQYSINKMVTADDIQKRRFENWLHHKH